MLEGHILLLAKAGFATDQKLRCKLVQPKCRRERGRNKPSQPIHSEPPSRLGQLAFESI